MASRSVKAKQVAPITEPPDELVCAEGHSCPLHPRVEAALQRLEHALAVIDAINFGELLAAPPAVRGERARHSTAVGLLSLLESELRMTMEGAREQSAETPSCPPRGGRSR